ncbi:MAG: tetratricopeptide repeat protein, partial [SAR324 cluster bacterium]|nr:tetratricopeptide repeat protein [SAR324 cluster bacterium]
KLQEGTLAMQAQDFQKALVLFSELTEEAPRFAEAWNKRATVLYLMGRLQESAKDVEQTLNLEPRHFGALSGKGLILMALKDWSGAIEAFEQGLKVHPNMSSAQSHLQFLKKKQKEEMT